MGRDLDFERVMQQLGVKPISGGPLPPSVSQSQVVFEQAAPIEDEPIFEDPDARLFKQAMASMHVAPNKDLSLPRGEHLSRRKVPKKLVFEADQTLDLHGQTVDAALSSLSAFVARSFAHNVKSILVITGKGKHSLGGRGVLKPAVEQWILNKGKRLIRSYAEAPRAHGGAGAFLLYLKSS